MIASVVNLLIFISKLLTLPPKKQQFSTITLKSNTVQTEPEKLLSELLDIDLADSPIDSLSEVAFIIADLSNLTSSYSTD
jgi:hypothetical protein